MRKEIIGDCTLILGDCLEIMPTLGKVDAVVTDPPYGTQNLGGGYGRRQLHNNGNGLSRVIANDSDLSVLEAACKVLPLNEGFAAIFLSSRKWKEFIDATQPLTFYGEIIWDKKNMGLGYHIRYSHESIAVFREGEPPKPKFPTNSVLEYYQQEKLHPHQKPVLLMADLVKWCAPESCLVLDPFMGSGTTGVACVKLGRKFIGIELEPKYFDIACKRIEDAYKQPDLFIPSPVKPVQANLLEGS